MKCILSKPIKVHGEECTELELAEPTAKDVRELGYPFSAVPGADGTPDLRLFPDVGAKYIARLARIPMSSVDQLAPGDLLTIHTEVCGFFAGAGTQGAPTSLTSTNASSTSPGSGA